MLVDKKKSKTGLEVLGKKVWKKIVLKQKILEESFDPPLKPSILKEVSVGFLKLGLKVLLKRSEKSILS